MFQDIYVTVSFFFGLKKVYESHIPLGAKGQCVLRVNIYILDRLGNHAAHFY